MSDPYLEAMMRSRPGDEVLSVDDLLADLMARPGWMAEAACRSVDRSVFFPGLGEDVRPAKAVCAACAVSEECTAYALETGANAGIWGGVTATNLHKRQRAA